jgi:hypothetical protein
LPPFPPLEVVAPAPAPAPPLSPHAPSIATVASNIPKMA